MYEKKIVVLAVVILLFRNMHAQSKNILAGYTLTHTISPRFGPGNSDASQSDTLVAKIFTLNDKVLYFSEVPTYIIRKDNELMGVKEDQYAFLYDKLNGTGYYFDSTGKKFKNKAKADSLLKYMWFAQIKIYPIFLENDHMLLSTGKSKKADTLIETYSLQGRGIDTNKTGTIKLSYIAAAKEQFSLSKELDSIKNMQLVKINTVNNPRELIGYNMFFPKIETSYALEKIKEPIDSSILKYFKY